MRYFLFVLLFIFTNHSFSDELDGKGIDCKMQDVDTEQYRQKMYWFNNGRWILVNIFDAQQFHRVNKSTNKKKLEEVGICKVFNGFEAVKRRQEDLIRIDQQEKKKAREGNKI